MTDLAASLEASPVSDRQTLAQTRTAALVREVSEDRTATHRVDSLASALTTMVPAEIKAQVSEDKTPTDLRPARVASVDLTTTEAPAKEVSAADKTATLPVDNLALAQITMVPVETRAVDWTVRLTTTDPRLDRVALVDLTSTDHLLDRVVLADLTSTDPPPARVASADLTSTDHRLDKAASVDLTTTAALAPPVVVRTALAMTRTINPARPAPAPATAIRLLPAVARVVCCPVPKWLKDPKLMY